jgi:tripartite-type tricarboxylate transporter receptor subunit TctC
MEEKPMKVPFWRSLALFLALQPGLAATPAFAQEFPARPIRLIVAFPAGSGIDSSTRLLAAKLTTLLGQSVIVENRPGASGIIGTEAAAKSPADGYTLYMSPPTPAVMMPFLYSRLPYDMERDFSPISLIGVSQTGILANPSVAAGNVGELVALSKKEMLNAATAGVGSNHHLYGEWFASMTGARINFIAYNTAAPINDVVAGHVQLMFDALSAFAGLVKSGKLKLLAITGKSRHSAFPDVPTFAESGYPEFEPLAWGGLFAPAGTPQAIIDRLGAAASSAAKSPDVVERYRMAGGEAIGSTPAEFNAFLKVERAKWSKVIKAAGVKLD